MMEIKQNAPVSLMDHVSKNVGNKDEDAILNDTFSAENPKNILNGTTSLENALNDGLDDDLDFQDAIDTADPITSDVEDALLADDGIDETQESKSNSVNAADKGDSSNDPGDALDKLLSKIHEVVEDADQPSEKPLDNNANNNVNVKEVNGDGATQEAQEINEAMDVDSFENCVAVEDDVDMLESAKETKKDDKMVVDEELSVSKESEKEEKETSLQLKTSEDPVENEKSENTAVAVSKDKADESIKENGKEVENNAESAEKNIDENTEQPQEEENKHSEQPGKPVDINKEHPKHENGLENLAGETKVLAEAEDQAMEIVDDKEKNKKSSEKDNILQKEENILEKDKLEKAQNNTEDIVQPAAAEDSLEEGEIIDDEDDKKNDQAEIPIVNLDDDDDVHSKIVKGSSKISIDPNEIVCLDDDDDESVTASKTEGFSKNNEQASKSGEEDTKTKEDSTEVATADKSATLLSDNTDNACDGLSTEATPAEEKDDKSTKNEKADTACQSSSSSSSNLLEEAQAPSDVPYETPDGAEDDDAEVEAEAEVEGDVEDADDVELIEDDSIATKEVADSDHKEPDAPPAKRLRLSEDDESNNKVSSTDNIKEKIETNIVPVVEKINEDASISNVDENSGAAGVTLSAGIKRSFSETNIDSSKKVEEISEVGALKKLKTVSEEKQEADKKIDTTSSVEPNIEINKSAKDEIDDSLLEYKPQPLIAVPSNKPIPLYPPPKLEESSTSVRLDFLSRFKKSFDKMTKNDLEELVLQKVVEALVHKNEFAELRLIIEKQENLIALHRAKIAQLGKQYRDLEMVHTRVVKDMREKNSQYLMPVRITRAVGLQVSTPITRKDIPLNSPTSNSNTGLTTPRSPQFNSNNNSTINQQRLTSPQRAGAVGNVSQSSNVVSSTSTNTTGNARRGCAQKITAQRPVDGNSNPLNPPMSSIPSGFLRPGAPKSQAANANQISQQNPTRVLNKNATSSLSQSVSNVRVRYTGNNVSVSQDPQRKSTLTQQQGISRQQNSPIASNSAKANTIIPNKNMVQQQQFRRSDSASSLTNSGKTTSSVMDQYKNSYNQPMSSVPTVSITPARPKDKSVIDLTDEDDMASTPPQLSPALNSSLNSRVRVAPQTQNNSTSRAVLPTLSRMPNTANVRPQITPRQLSTMQVQKSTNMQQISTPPGTSITRVSISASNPATQRLKYNHPAPLPSTPPQQFSPAWKLPPPRPTIRISNLDNGIVISWTMEESMERHADCVTYQIYAYQETNAPPSVDSWRHVGDVKAMLLPMAVTLTQFQEDQRYYFAVRAVDVHQRYGAFSAPKTWN